MAFLGFSFPYANPTRVFLLSPPTESFTALVRQAQLGDVHALKWIVVRFEPLIRSECSRFGLWDFPEWSHSDLFQEVTIRVLTKVDQFRGEDSGNSQALFESWLRATTKNTVHNILRKQGNTLNRPDAPMYSLDGQLEVVDGLHQATASSMASRQEQEDNYCPRSSVL